MISLKHILAATTCTLLLAYTACKKKDVYLGAPPTISLKTGAGYLADKDTVSAGDTVTIGVTASANGSVDKLRDFVMRRSLNGDALETIKDLDIPADQKENYSADFKLIVQTQGKQLYKMVVVNTHGLESEVLLNITVVP